MRDIDVRNTLLDELGAAFADDPGTLIVQELPIGMSRVDVAVINGKIHGFEIKSASDTLTRLTSQAGNYNAVFDEITIVVASCHMAMAMEKVPQWWGVTEAKAQPDGAVRLFTVRPCSANPRADAESIAWLLWRDEMLEILDEAALSRGNRTKTRAQLAKVLASSMQLDELRKCVRRKLRSRQDWRPDAVRM